MRILSLLSLTLFLTLGPTIQSSRAQFGGHFGASGETGEGVGPARLGHISNPEEPREIGHFDTTPNDKANPPGFFGAWTAFPYFESGTVIVSSIGEGLFIVKPREQEMP